MLIGCRYLSFFGGGDSPLDWHYRSCKHVMKNSSIIRSNNDIQSSFEESNICGIPSMLRVPTPQTKDTALSQTPSILDFNLGDGRMVVGATRTRRSGLQVNMYARPRAVCMSLCFSWGISVRFGFVFRVSRFEGRILRSGKLAREILWWWRALRFDCPPASLVGIGLCCTIDGGNRVSKHRARVAWLRKGLRFERSSRQGGCPCFRLRVIWRHSFLIHPS